MLPYIVCLSVASFFSLLLLLLPFPVVVGSRFILKYYTASIQSRRVLLICDFVDIYLCDTLPIRYDVISISLMYDLFVHPLVK